MTAAGDHPGRGPVIGRVAELWRYPVKSLGGERLACATLEARGMAGDRLWAVRGEDGRIGSGKTTRRFRRMPHLLSLTAHTDPDGVVWIAFPDGRCGRADDPQTAAWVGEVTGAGVGLGEDEGAAHFDDAPLHVVTTADLADLQASRGGAAPTDPRRFRPNLVVEAEVGLVPGGRCLVGEAATIATTGATVRCVMTTMAQPGLDFVPSSTSRSGTKPASASTPPWSGPATSPWGIRSPCCRNDAGWPRSAGVPAVPAVGEGRP